MSDHRRPDIERRRTRLLSNVFIVLVALAILVALIGVLGPDLVEPLHRMPLAARLSILLLSLGFIALVREKDRQLREIQKAMQSYRDLATASAGRLQTIETLLSSAERVSVPVALDDVLQVILETAIELSEARAGSIELHERGPEGEVTVGRRYPEGLPPSADMGVRVPLEIEGRSLGMLKLALPPGMGLEPERRDVLDRFAIQAAAALDRARIFSVERASAEYLRAAHAVRTRFLGTVSHELLTPLTPIIGYSVTMQKHWDRLSDQQKRDFLLTIRDQGERMRRQVNRLLEAARVEIGSLTIQPIRHDLRDSIVDAVRSFGLDKRRMDLRLPESPVTAEADPFAVQEIASNVIENALRYTKGRIEITLTPHPYAVALTVADEGPGPSSEVAKRMTEASTAVGPGGNGGTGLGLHVVRTLVADHGGECAIHTDERGTTVAVLLPRSRDVRLRRSRYVRPQNAV